MRRNGFTLIELLVVISIIALLLAIMMPALGVVKQKAQGVVCTARLKNLLIAYRTYAAENEDKLPSGNTMHPDLTGDPEQKKEFRTCWVWTPETEDGNVIDWRSAQTGTVKEKINGIEKGVIWPYIKDEEAYHCPADKRSTKPAAEPGWSGMGGYRSYSIPAGLNGGDADWIYTRLSQVKRPSHAYAFVEEAEGRGFNINSWMLPRTGDRWIDPIGIWHNEQSTLGFVDGHAVIHKWRDKTTLEMGWNQEVDYPVDPTKDGEIEDLRYMQERYPYNG